MLHKFELGTFVSVNDRWKRNVLRRCLNEYHEQQCRCHVWWKTVPEVGAGNCKRSEVEKLNSGTASWLEEADRSLCRDGTPVTGVKYDDQRSGRRSLAVAWSVLLMDPGYTFIYEYLKLTARSWTVFLIADEGVSRRPLFTARLCDKVILVDITTSSACSSSLQASPRRFTKV